METEQIKHQRYSVSFSNSHKVVENYLYFNKKILTNVCENLFTLWFQIRIIPSRLFHRYGYTMLGMEPTSSFRTGDDWMLQEIPFISCIFIVFDKIKTCVCRKSLMWVFQDISDQYSFSDHRCHCRILANILINVFCKKINPRSIREAKQKVIKLSSWIFYWPLELNIVYDFIGSNYFMFNLNNVHNVFTFL